MIPPIGAYLDMEMEADKRQSQYAIDLEKKVQDLMVENASLRTDRDELKKHVSEIEVIMHGLSGTIDTKNSQIDDLNAQIDVLNDEIDSLRDKAKELNDTIKKMIEISKEFRD